MRSCFRINARLTLTERTATASSPFVSRRQERFEIFDFFFNTGLCFSKQERHCIKKYLALARTGTQSSKRGVQCATVSQNAKKADILLIPSTHRYGLFYCRSNIVSAFDRFCNFVTVHDLIWIRKSENTATLKVRQVSIL